MRDTDLAIFPLGTLQSLLKQPGGTNPACPRGLFGASFEISNPRRAARPICAIRPCASLARGLGFSPRLLLFRP